jgi:wnt family
MYKGVEYCGSMLNRYTVHFIENRSEDHVKQCRVLSLTNVVMSNLCHVMNRSLSKVESYWNQSRDCRALTLPNSRPQQRQQPNSASVLRLPKAQRRFCARRLWMMPAVTHAARSAVEVCQELFADKRWNCSSVLLAPRLTPDLTEGMRRVCSWSSVQCREFTMRGSITTHSVMTSSL